MGKPLRQRRGAAAKCRTRTSDEPADHHKDGENYRFDDSVHIDRERGSVPVGTSLLSCKDTSFIVIKKALRLPPRFLILINLCISMFVGIPLHAQRFGRDYASPQQGGHRTLPRTIRPHAWQGSSRPSVGTFAQPWGGGSAEQHVTVRATAEGWFGETTRDGSRNRRGMVRQQSRRRSGRACFLACNYRLSRVFSLILHDKRTTNHE